MQEDLRSLRLALLCTSATGTHMESRAGEIAEDQVAVMHLSIFIRMCVTEAESVATALSLSPLYLRGGHLWLRRRNSLTPEQARASWSGLSVCPRCVSGTGQLYRSPFTVSPLWFRVMKTTAYTA